MARKPVSQSNTQWNAKGSTLSDGTVVKKGYLSQKGKDTKRVTARVNLVEGKRAGQTQKYVTGNKARGRPSTAVGGYNPAVASRGGSSTGSPRGGNTGAVTGMTAAQIAAKKRADAKATVTAKGRPDKRTAFSDAATSRGRSAPSAYQAGRGQTAEPENLRIRRQNAAISNANLKAYKGRQMTSSTVRDALVRSEAGQGLPFYLGPKGGNSPARREIPSTYKEPTATQKASVTYLPNGNARVWYPKQKKFIVVGPTDPRFPRKKGY